LTLARKAQKKFLIGQSSRSHVTYRPTISGWLLVVVNKYSYYHHRHRRRRHVNRQTKTIKPEQSYRHVYTAPASVTSHFITVWPWSLTFWSQVNACRATSMHQALLYAYHNDFGVFLLDRGQTDRQANKVTDVTDRPNHASPNAGVVNQQLY